MKNKLAHLTAKQLADFIDEYYYKKITLKDLLKKYDLPSSISNVWKYFPDKVLNEKCPYCNVSLLQSYCSKQFPKVKPAYCPECSHEVVEGCRCQGCYLIKQAELKKEREQKRERYRNRLKEISVPKIDWDLLNFEEKVYLGALLQSGISDDYSYILPIENFENVLAPTSFYTYDIIMTLYRITAISFHPDANIDSISLDPIDNSITYYPFKMKWDLNIAGSDRATLVDSIVNPSFAVKPDEAYKLWKEIAMYESIEYLCYSMANILKVEYKVGEKTKSVLSDFLNYYSVAQIYNIIYRSINNVLRFRAEKNLTELHTANMVINSMQRFVEKAQEQGWELQKYNRLQEYPESALSKFFFEKIFPIGNRGFSEVPRLPEE